MHLQFSATGKRGAPMKRSPSFKAGGTGSGRVRENPATANLVRDWRLHIFARAIPHSQWVR